MYKIWAKVNLNSEKYDAKGLVRAFFGKMNFNSRNSLVIRNEEAKIEIVFEEFPPADIMEAISNCKIMELNFGKVLEEYNGETEAEPEGNEEEEEPHAEPEPEDDEEEEKPHDETGPEGNQEEKEPHAEPEPEGNEEEKEPHTEPEPEDGEAVEKPRKQTKRKGKPKVLSPEDIDIPELNKILKEATSFEHFVKLVGVWLEMGVRQDFFKKLVDTSIKIEDISWAKISEALKDRGVSYSNWDKIWTSRQVSNKLEKYSVTMISFLLVMKHYRKSFFIPDEVSDEANFDEAETVAEEAKSNDGIKSAEGNEEVFEEQVPTETVDEISENEVKIAFDEEQPASDEVASPTPIKVRMECMPEIPSFEKALKTVDRTQPVEERVKHVLTAMGWDKKHSKEKNMVFEVVNVAVRVKDISTKSIFSKVNIRDEDKMSAWMYSAKFINDFVKLYYPNLKVKLQDFLKELQEIVVLESEIESSTA